MDIVGLVAGFVTLQEKRALTPFCGPHFVVLWALFYFLLPDNAGLNNWAEAIYFSIVTFTTLGYGDVTLSPAWRQLSGMEAMVGIVVFGLTTAILFTVIQRVWRVGHQPPQR